MKIEGWLVSLRRVRIPWHRIYYHYGWGTCFPNQPPQIP